MTVQEARNLIRHGYGPFQLAETILADTLHEHTHNKDILIGSIANALRAYKEELENRPPLEDVKDLITEVEILNGLDKINGISDEVKIFIDNEMVNCIFERGPISMNVAEAVNKKWNKNYTPVEVYKIWKNMTF